MAKNRLYYVTHVTPIAGEEPPIKHEGLFVGEKKNEAEKGAKKHWGKLPHSVITATRVRLKEKGFLKYFRMFT